MKTVYFVYSEDAGEVEGMFDADENLIDTWCCNDAHWRDEYFARFMEWCGVVIKYAEGKRHDRLLKKLNAAWSD